MVGHVAPKKELDTLKKVFILFDSNGDGTLTRNELIRAWKQAFDENQAASEAEIDKILKRVDNDGSGSLDYSEWIVGTINLAKLFQRKKLQIVFNLFDTDKGGTITADEIKGVLMPENILEDDMELWDKILDEVDINGDGVIDFDEFSIMMQKLIR